MKPTPRVQVALRAVKSAKSKISSRLLFTMNFFKNPLRNASFAPSSTAASKAMLKNLDFSSIHTVVELGPGTGVMTEEILKKCRPGTKVLLIEIEKTYVRLLRDRFGSRVVVVRAGAEHLNEILEKQHMQKVDLIVSGLPFIAAGPEKKLLHAIRRHTDKGAAFRFFTYVPPLMKRAYKLLPIREISFVPKNLPPLWIYGVN